MAVLGPGLAAWAPEAKKSAKVTTRRGSGFIRPKSILGPFPARALGRNVEADSVAATRSPPEGQNVRETPNSFRITDRRHRNVTKIDETIGERPRGLNTAPRLQTPKMTKSDSDESRQQIDARSTTTTTTTRVFLWSSGSQSAAQSSSRASWRRARAPWWSGRTKSAYAAGFGPAAGPIPRHMGASRRREAPGKPAP